MIALPLDKAVFGAWLPHVGEMVLLDTLCAWSPTDVLHPLQPYPQPASTGRGRPAWQRQSD